MDMVLGWLCAVLAALMAVVSVEQFGSIVGCHHGMTSDAIVVIFSTAKFWAFALIASLAGGVAAWALITRRDWGRVLFSGMCITWSAIVIGIAYFKIRFPLGAFVCEQASEAAVHESMMSAYIVACVAMLTVVGMGIAGACRSRDGGVCRPPQNWTTVYATHS